MSRQLRRSPDPGKIDRSGRDRLLQALRERGIKDRIARRGKDTSERLGRHRWVVERTLAWLSMYRGILIRWEKKKESFEAMLHFACAWITFRAAGYFEQPLFG